MKRILLIEPPYRSSFLPLGLQKIAAYHLKRKDEVKFLYGYPNFSFIEQDTFDIVYITSLFTYQGMKVINTINQCKQQLPKAEIKVGGIFASLMPDFIEKHTGIKPHVGVWDRVDMLPPNYSCFPETNQAIVFTTRGCAHKCKFCAVKTLEPEYYVLPGWKDQFNTAYQHGIREYMIQDNNFIASPFSHQKEVIQFLADHFNNCLFEFNGGLDCRLFQEKHAKLLSKIKIKTVRFAFDGMHEDGYLQEAIKLAKRYIKGRYRIYVLYNFTDTPEDFYYRCREIANLKAEGYPMKYAPLDSIKRNYIGKHWDKKKIKNLMNMIQVRSIDVIAPANINEQLGRSVEEFMKRINSDIPDKTIWGRLSKTSDNLISLLDEEKSKIRKEMVSNWNSKIRRRRK